MPIVIYQKRGVYYVKDPAVVLHAEGRKDKGYRPVLIMMKSVSSSDDIFHCIPLSTSAKQDALVFNVEGGYEFKNDGFVPEKNSAALIKFFQPIEKQYFSDYLGMLDETTYEAIKNILVTEIIGFYDQYDTSV
jgi:PemK-like, MazF-like toxin of type II toxin-antitoxin system